MATIKIKFKASKVEGREGALFFQITHNRVVKQINVHCKVSLEDWSMGRSRLNLMNVLSRQDIKLINRWDIVRFEYKRLQQIIFHRDICQQRYSVDDIAEIYVKHHKNTTLFGFTLETIARLKEVGNITNAENYFSLLVSFMTFRKGEDIELKSLNSDLLEAYEAYLKHKVGGSSLNSISFYMRTLRAIFNRAVEKGLVKEQSLFRRVYTSIEKTAKRAIPLSYITKLKEIDLIDHPELEFARDLFLFSFYTRGMSFVDIAYLKKHEIKNGEFTYRRSKTGQSIRVKWEQCMADIVDRHNIQESEYLLPIITNPKYDARQQYIDMRDRVNRNLKRLASIAGIPHNITMYVARHSWASIAKAKNISISVISEAMGHDSEATTKIYLASLDIALIDDANRLIIGLV
ncbi:MAG: site-specific integrase [Rikenellaceae bacterium]